MTKDKPCAEPFLFGEVKRPKAAPRRSSGSKRQNPAPEGTSDTPPSAKPSTRTSGVTFGYARVSLDDGSQDPARQVSELEAAGADRIFTDRVSGLRAHKPELEKLLSHLREGDCVMCTELSRLGRDVRGTLELVDRLEERGVALRVLNLGLDTSTPTGRVVLTVLVAVSRLEVDLLRERTKSGLAEARRQGVRLGRPPALSQAQVREVKRMWKVGRAAQEIADVFGVSRRTIERAVGSES